MEKTVGPQANSFQSSVACKLLGLSFMLMDCISFQLGALLQLPVMVAMGTCLCAKQQTFCIN